MAFCDPLVRWVLHILLHTADVEDRNVSAGYVPELDLSCGAVSCLFSASGCRRLQCSECRTSGGLQISGLCTLDECQEVAPD